MIFTALFYNWTWDVAKSPNNTYPPRQKPLIIEFNPLHPHRLLNSTAEARNAGKCRGLFVSWCTRNSNEYSKGHASNHKTEQRPRGFLALGRGMLRMRIAKRVESSGRPNWKLVSVNCREIAELNCSIARYTNFEISTLFYSNDMAISKMSHKHLEYFSVKEKITVLLDSGKRGRVKLAVYCRPI